MYFDNAATTVVKPTQVAEAMFKVISSQKYGNPSRGSHEYAINSLSIVNKCRQNIKKLFGLREEDEVVFFTKRPVMMQCYSVLGGIWYEEK